MIDFRCHCGEALSVPADQAGGLIQCPSCRRLMDVPLPGEQDAFDVDGAYRMGPEPPPPPKPVVLLPPPLFQPGHMPPPESPQAPAGAASAQPAVGVPVPAGSSAPAEAIPLARPHYDPETGELVRPMELQPVPVGKSLPAAPAPVLAYRSDDGMEKPHSIALMLCMPANLLVMSFALLYALLASINGASGPGLALTPGHILMRLVPIAGVALLLAHYGTVIDEIGPEGKDELPRPLRNVSWSDDLFGPFIRVLAALLICYGPSILVADVPGLHLLVLLAGSLLLPAMLLTLVTSGSVLNLRPDRVVGVMRTCEGYLAVSAWGAAAVLLYFGHLTAALGPRLDWPGLRALEFFLAVYLGHYFCWRLGHLYREHAEQFPWVLQRHEHRAPQAPVPPANLPPRSNA